MKLNENYSIIRDFYNVILRFESEGSINEKTGKPTVTQKEWYYKTLEDALLAFFDKSLVGTETVEEMIDLIKETERKICKTVKNEGIASSYSGSHKLVR